MCIVEAAEEAVQDADGDVEEVQDTGAKPPPAKKRKKAIVPRAKSRGMSSTEAWNVACELAPDVFAHTHKDSHRCWTHDTKPKPATPGRKKKVTDIQITELTAFAHSLLQKGAVFSLPIFREYVLKKLAPLTVSPSWCYKFLVGTGLRLAKLRVSDKKQFSAVEEQTLNDFHRRRI
eukprot:63924-Amphidinium_carterae.1